MTQLTWATPRDCERYARLIQAEMAKVKPSFVEAQLKVRADEAEACASNVLTLTALHGAIQAQLGAQPGYVSALEYVKDNAERLGVNAAIHRVVSRVTSVEVDTEELGRKAREGIEVVKARVDAGLTTAKSAIENIAGRLFGGR